MRTPRSAAWRRQAVAAGTALANIHGFHAGLVLSAWGFVFGLLSGATYAFFLYVSEGVSTQTSPFFRAAIVTSISALLISLIYVPSPALLRASIHGLWVFGVLIGLFSQAVPTSLFGIGIPRVGGAASAILGSVELPVAVILASVIVHEHVLWTGWAGVALIIIGIALGQRRTSAAP
ncbi:MAG: EamA family transporter [Bacilli bacterium]